MLIDLRLDSEQLQNIPVKQQSKPKSEETEYSTSHQNSFYTVLFVDIVNSTSLAEGLSPKKLHDLLINYYTSCQKIVEANNGIVVRLIGDCVFAAFGTDSKEQDASNAIRCGQSMLIHFSSDPHYSVRITTASDYVYTNGLIGQGPALQQSIFGQAPFVAARLKEVAQPNSIVTTTQTKSIISERFSFKDLGEVTLKGFKNPFHAWSLLH